MLCLTKKGQIEKWDIISGKMVSESTYNELFDYSKYEVFSETKKDRATLVSIDVIEDAN